MIAHPVKFLFATLRFSVNSESNFKITFLKLVLPGDKDTCLVCAGQLEEDILLEPHGLGVIVENIRWVPKKRNKTFEEMCDV